jgi:hypothetical protein
MPSSTTRRRLAFAAVVVLGTVGTVVSGGWALAGFTDPQNNSTGIPYEGYLEHNGGPLTATVDLLGACREI